MPNQAEVNHALQAQLTELTVMQDIQNCVLQALIATHPDRQALGSAFEQACEAALAQYVPTAVSEDTLAVLHSARQSFAASIRRTL